MAINFPSNPSNGDTHAGFTYSSSVGAWRATAGVSTTLSNTAPSSPSDGDLWWNTNTSKLYISYDDGSSTQWVQAAVPGATGATGAAGADGSSVTSYANTSAFPSSGNSVGDFAFATNTKAVYIWDGSEWDRISAGVDESPIILTEPPTTHTLSNAGTNTSLTMLATDPEGFDITYGIAYKNAGSTLPDQLAQVPVISQSNGNFTFIPTSNTSNAGSFRARLSASDGVKTTTRLVDFSLTFAISADFLVVAGGGGGAGWGGGGGGAGGLRTSYGSLSGGGASAESSAAFAPGETYTITIGDGGIGGGSAGTTNYEGVDGANSSIIGSGVSLISIGGGGGGGGNGATVGRDGGSGGGGGNALAGGSGTAGQGYDGGAGDSDGGHPYGHGGGGGAGAVGFDDPGSTTDSGAGGAGLQVNIDGNNYYWAGGGGGGAHNGSGTRFSDGGIGGGGGGSGYEDFGAGGGSALNSGQNGATYGSGVGAGGTNTGGGGGAAAGGARVGGQGGSGIVIIRAAQAASSTTGSPTVTTVGSDTVYTFTSDGSITF